MNDLKFAFRQLLKNPGFTAVAVSSLALGIGVNIVIFSFINALLLRTPSGVREPGRLVSIWHLDRSRGASLDKASQLSYLDYAYYRDHCQSLAGLLAYGSDGVHASWSRGGQAEMHYGQLVSGNYFSVLGVPATLGRTFLAEEDQTPGTHPVVVLSDKFWKQNLGSDPNVVGTALNLNGHIFTVVGVAPAGFTGLLPGFGSDFWAPLAMADQLGAAGMLESRTSIWLFVTGRLKPGATLSQTRAELATLAKRLEPAGPGPQNNRDAVAVPATLVPAMARGPAIAASAILMVAVGLVLLIACANAANLMLAQAAVRSREMAIRTALGAKRSRLIRQTLTESTLLALAGGAGGLMLALWIVPSLLALIPPIIPLTFDLSIDVRVAGFSLALSLLTGFLFGIIPALRGSRIDVAAHLKAGFQAGGAVKSRLRNVLVVGQVAVGLVLLIGAGLCVRSLLNAQAIDIGFEPKRALAAQFDLRTRGYSEAQGRLFYRQLLERVETLPGVQSAALANYLPLGPAFLGMEVAIAGRQPPPSAAGFFVGARFVGPNYFRTMGTQLLRGRGFTGHESETGADVVVIDDEMARRFWPNANPIGQRIEGIAGENRRSLEIIGVAKAGKYRSLGENPRPFMYRPFGYQARATLVVRSVADPKPLLETIRRDVRGLDPNLAVVRLGTLEEHMAFPLFPAKASGTLLGALGLLALVLALVGLYGVIAFFVSQRTREIGIRMALGAERSEVLRLVMRHGLRLSVIGVGIGCVGALAVTRVLSSVLYGIRPYDPVTFAGVPLLLLAVAALACFIPASRATKVDPMEALRCE